MKSISIILPGHKYDIIWENDIEKLKDLIKSHMSGSLNFIITNDTIFSIYEKTIKTLFPGIHLLIIKDGEEFKNFETIKNLANQLLELGANRKSRLWAFGGGVIGDITGFLASIYMRGIQYFQVPTTLLSMVDSSVGGKTGVNLENGKNMIGTFHQPNRVFIHVNFLNTLSLREYKCGLSEVIKTALLSDSNLFKIIEDNHQNILNVNSGFLETMSRESVSIKAKVVMEDEKENGIRAILNLGHTLAHALESNYQYTGIKHGEAVSIGLCFAAFLSLELGIFPSSSFERIRNLLKKLELMYRWIQLPEPKPKIPQIIEFMKGDKKNQNDQIRFVLLNEIGSVILPRSVDLPIIENSLEKFIWL